MSKVRLLGCTAVLVLALAGCGGGGDSDSATTTAPKVTHPAKPKAKTPPPGSRIDDGPMTIDLKPVYKSEASGTVHYVKAPSGAAVLKIKAEGLPPASASEEYVLWQYSSRNDMSILGHPRVAADGSLSETLRSVHWLYLIETEVKVQLLIS